MVHKKSPKQTSIQIINTTAKVIHEAHRAVKAEKNFTGDLAVAVKHQKFAQKLFKEEKYKAAADHAMFARKSAVKAIKANKKPVRAEYEKKQVAVKEKMPSEEELKAAVSTEEDIDEKELIKEETLELSVH